MKFRQFGIRFALTFILSVLLLALPINAKVFAQSSNEVTIYLFWGEGCPHCAKAKPFLEELTASNPKIHLNEYEIYNNEENLAFLKQVAQGFGFTPTKVPTIFIGDQYWEGYTDQIEKEIREAVETNLVRGSTNRVAAILGGEIQQPVGKKMGITPLLIILTVVFLIIITLTIIRERRIVGKSKK